MKSRRITRDPLGLVASSYGVTSDPLHFFVLAVAGDDATIAFAMSEEHDPVVTVSVLTSELTILRSELRSELTILRSELRSELTDLRSELEKRISEEGAMTRAHFDIMVEKVNDSVRLVAEVSAHHATILDNRESRLQKIEER